MITVVGGVYLEICMHPKWLEYFGSGGRAASALLELGSAVTLHSFADKKGEIEMNVNLTITSERGLFTYVPAKLVEDKVTFKYHHSLAFPTIAKSTTADGPIQVKADRVIRYGMLEGEAIVEADWAVYDPQNPKPVSFKDNGSTAKHLALVLNQHEACTMAKQYDKNPKRAAATLIANGDAEVVIIKMGPQGLLVTDKSTQHFVPPYQTDNVWKIGSGDTFVATFGYFWMLEGRPPLESAFLASKATAYYVTHKKFVTHDELSKFERPAVMPSDTFLQGKKPNIYLAGPFFTLSQLWLVDEAKKCFSDMGMDVFSPFHKVGLGSASEVVQKDLDGIDKCDILYAICDGLDSGTVYEIGYARAKNIPVVIYAENETLHSLKMMEGSSCFICQDFATSIYRAVWEAISK